MQVLRGSVLYICCNRKLNLLYQLGYTDSCEPLVSYIFLLDRYPLSENHLPNHLSMEYLKTKDMCSNLISVFLAICDYLDNIQESD